MKVLVDIGNTRLKYINSAQLDTHKIEAVVNIQINEQWLNEYWADVNEIIVASVNTTHTLDTIKSWATKNNIKTTHVESEGQRFGLTSFYQVPEQLGVDRWLAMLGALFLFPKENILIIDAGTATTVDLLSNDGKHLGGWIIPGIKIMFDSLLANTSKVKAEFNHHPSLAFGNSTNTNVNNACWAATVGAIELAIVESRKRFKQLDKIILIGGNAEKLKALLSCEILLEEKLIFRGLHRYTAI